MIPSRAEREARELVNRYFNSWSRTDKWLNAPNSHLGGIAPIQMILQGGGVDLIADIKDALRGKNQEILNKRIVNGDRKRA